MVKRPKKRVLKQALVKSNVKSRKNKTTPGSITLQDVARVVGVSAVTVSRALNYPEKVAPHTLEKINDAIEKTGYVPNLLAGALSSRKSHLVAAIVPSIVNSVYSDTVRLFNNKLRESGYQVLLGECGHSDTHEEELVATVLSRRPDGIYLTGVNHSKRCRNLLLSANIPIVETWDLTMNPLDTVVGFSHEQVGFSVAEFLIQKGYKRIGLVSGDDQRAMRRRTALSNALAHHGIQLDIALVIPPTTFDYGRQGMADLLDRGFINGAVFFSSDTLAQGALAEIHARGLKVPEDIALIGFGDEPFAARMFPALTTVKFDRQKIGRYAAEILLARLNDLPVEKNIIDVGFYIAERDTT